MTMTTGPRRAGEPQIDDYQIDREIGQATRPATYHMLAVFNGVLLVILAGVSFALAWIVAMLLGIV